MMDKTTLRILRYFEQRANMTPLFFTSLFQAPPENYFNGRKVTMDVQRNGELLAPAIRSTSSAVPITTDDGYTNKEFEPPVVGEGFVINSDELMDRVIGANPYDDPMYVQSLLSLVARGISTRLEKFKRTNEYQAAQVLQTGHGYLLDINGNQLYDIDYKPKSTHFPTVTTSWSSAGADALGDLESLAEVIRDDGQTDVNAFVMGATAFENFIANTAVQSRFDNRRIDMGAISPYVQRGNGSQYRGTIDLGNYKVDVLTYNAKYQAAGGTTKTRYLADTKVVALADSMRLDACFGGIPDIAAAVGKDQSIRERIGLQRRVPLPSVIGDLYTNVFAPEDGESIRCTMKARPVFIPTAIDQFGCLETTAA